MRRFYQVGYDIKFYGRYTTTDGINIEARTEERTCDDRTPVEVNLSITIDFDFNRFCLKNREI